MVDVLADLEADELLRERVILELTALDQWAVALGSSLSIFSADPTSSSAFLR